MDYRYALDCDVAESVLRLSSRHREELISLFRGLAKDGFQRGDHYFRDSSSREIQKKRFGNWMISCWADHPVKELRIVGVQRIVG